MILAIFEIDIQSPLQRPHDKVAQNPGDKPGKRARKHHIWQVNENSARHYDGRNAYLHQIVRHSACNRQSASAEQSRF